MHHEGDRVAIQLSTGFGQLVLGRTPSCDYQLQELEFILFNQMVSEERRSRVIVPHDNAPSHDEPLPAVQPKQ